MSLVIRRPYLALKIRHGSFVRCLLPPADRRHSDMASSTIVASQLAGHKTVAPARMVLRTPQQPQSHSSISFGPKLGCNAHSFNARRSGAISAQRRAHVVVSAVAGKGYKASKRNDT